MGQGPHPKPPEPELSDSIHEDFRHDLAKSNLQWTTEKEPVPDDTELGRMRRRCRDLQNEVQDLRDSLETARTMAWIWRAATILLAIILIYLMIS